MRVDHVIEHFVQRALGDSRESRKFLVSKPAKALRNISGR